MRLFHFSSEPDIKEFVPRPPLKHPDEEPFVYAIEERHSPLYLFPRDCPRIGVWDKDDPDFVMALYIDHSWLEKHKEGSVYRYELPPETFITCQDHGAYVSRTAVKPLKVELITQLPRAITTAGAILEATDLEALAHRLYDRDKGEWTTSLHVSMIRLVNLPNWDGQPGKPVAPKSEKPSPDGRGPSKR